jgi:hypothetical protein
MAQTLGPTDYLAIYGAGLSTIVAIWEYFRSRSKVRVVLIFAVEDVEGETQHGLGISIQNPSGHTVHITNVSFLYPYRKLGLWNRVKNVVRFRRILRNDGWCHSALSLHGVEDQCPVSIEPGKSHYIFVRHETLEKVLADAQPRRLKAVVQDALWRNKYSKAFDYPKIPVEAAT